MELTGKIKWAALCGLLLAACSSDRNTETAAVENEEVTEAKVIPVRVLPIEMQAIPRTLDYTANLIAFREINFAPASPGRIDRINVEVGDRIRKGQVLVEMDKTQFNQAAEQYENLKVNFQRVDTLRQLGSISEQQYDQVSTQYEVAKSSYEFMKENTTMTSPIDGIVTGKYFENGEMYSAVPNTAAGKAAILSLMQINPLKAVVSISQSYFPSVKEGMKAEITTDIYPDKVFTGSVYKVYPTIDAATRSFKTEIIIQNNSELLRPGMFGTINLKLEEVDALVVPSIAVLKQEGTNNRYVFINDNGKAKQIFVTPGKRFDDKIEIIADGIAKNDELIIEGQANLLDGTEVKVVQ